MCLLFVTRGPLSTVSQAVCWVDYCISFSRDLPGLGIEPASPKLAGGFFSTESPGSPNLTLFPSRKYIKCQKTIFVLLEPGKTGGNVFLQEPSVLSIPFSLPFFCTLPSSPLLICFSLQCLPQSHDSLSFHPQLLDHHLSCLVFAEDRCQMRKLFEQLLSKSLAWHCTGWGLQASCFAGVAQLGESCGLLLSTVLSWLETRIHFLLSSATMNKGQSDEKPACPHGLGSLWAWGGPGIFAHLQ